MTPSIRSGVLLLTLAAGCTGSISGPDADQVSSQAPAGGMTAPGSEPKAAPEAGVPPLRRLTFTQYFNAVRDVLGEPLPALVLDQEPAVHGFTSVGATAIVTSPLGVERYDAAARAIASLVMGDVQRRAVLVGCVPQQPADVACAESFLGELGKQLYRRALTDGELERLVLLATSVATASSDFWSGAEAALSALLSSPKFLYRVELGTVESDGSRRYTAYDAAARLAFFLWNSTPDDELLEAAARGELASIDGRRTQAARLLASPKARAGFRSFFGELLRIDDPSARADAAMPVSESLLVAMHEQALRTFEDAMFGRQQTFGELVRTPFTFLNDELADHYGLPRPGSVTLTQVTLAAEQDRLGLLGFGAVLMKQSNPPNTSPTGRGKFVREALLCQVIPPPPPGVATELPSVPEGVRVSMKERLEIHRADPLCSSCHALMDPIGLGLENFDAFGRYRQEDQQLPIDPAGELDGVAFADPRGLAAAVSEHPALAGCFALQVARYLTGEAEPHPAVMSLAESYAASGGSFDALLTRFVESDVFVEARGKQ